MKKKLALKYDSCASDIYHLLWDRKKLALCEIYDYLSPLWTKSSIRRSIYELRDQRLISKSSFDDQWYFNVKAKPMPILKNVSGYQPDN